ncbi:MAG: APC family permease [Elusimicrobia bacterium]|nr:APC family permease [Elusimicrobiota bacterium]MDE2511728.1 APC family permease [Elusimicrobiota bacterium]
MKAEPRPGRRVTEVVVLTTAMLSFISFWRASAIVLCDLASTAYYIGGIVEQAVGKSAPWFILAVMAFSYTIRAVYMESCSMFVRGGVYKVVKEAMGGTIAKLSASALMFDYVLTGPISAVAGGQYLAGLLNTLFPHFRIGWHLDPNSFAMVFAIAATLYFWRENIKGIHESSDKALRIMQLTSVMAVVMMAWCFYTLWLHPAPLPPLTLNFSPAGLGWAKSISWLKPVGAVGITMAFGHSLLAMSGEESLAQVYREIEAPKIKNLEKTGLVIFVYSMLLTSLVSFFAVMIIPDSIRISQYGDNLLSGLAMSVVGPHWARLLLQSFVVGVGVVILAGAANTSIVGANGVLNRLAEDGILVDWFRDLHKKYGTTHRLINLIVGLQIATILLCRGDVYMLGEAYAFGVVWSFVFKTMAVMMLRFKNREPREFLVPGNIRIGDVEWPIGLALIFVVLLCTAMMNLITKRVATVSGSIFTAVFFGIFLYSEHWNEKHHGDAHDLHEKFNLRQEDDLVRVRGSFHKPIRVLVAVRDPKNMLHVVKALEELDSEKTEMVVFTSRIRTGLGLVEETIEMDTDEQKLFTRVLEVAEKAGKSITPMLVVSNEPFYAIAQAAQAVGASEVIFGVSAKLSTDAQLERLAMTWGSLPTDSKQPVRFRIVGPGVEHAVDL